MTLLNKIIQSKSTLQKITEQEYLENSSGLVARYLCLPYLSFNWRQIISIPNGKQECFANAVSIRFIHWIVLKIKLKYLESKEASPDWSRNIRDAHECEFIALSSKEQSRMKISKKKASVERRFSKSKLLKRTPSEENRLREAEKERSINLLMVKTGQIQGPGPLLRFTSLSLVFRTLTTWMRWFTLFKFRVFFLIGSCFESQLKLNLSRSLLNA